MKHGFIPLFLLACTLTAAPVRVALIGDGNPVDKTTAELSSDENIELLERNQIHAVLQEHKLNAAALSAGQLAKHIPHADVFAVFTPERMVVFNAKNGFRLWDGKPENASAGIRLAIAKKDRKDPVYLSVVSVRDIGIPSALEPKIKELTVLLEQALIQSPAIQFLERERLGEVREERLLTEKQFALLPSARLLTFEFEPAQGNTVDVRLLLRNTGDKLLGECMEKDVFRDMPSAVLSLQRQLHSLLNRTQRNANIKAEAARYFGEFTALKNSKYNLTPECTAKLEAALALDPDNPKYRYEEIGYRAQQIERLPYPQRVRLWRSQWELCRKFREQFPPSKWKYLLFCRSYVLPGLGYRELLKLAPGTPDYALVEEIIDQARACSLKDYRFWQKLPESIKDVSSLKDLERNIRFLVQAPFELYISYSRVLEARMRNDYEYYRVAEDYLQKHPEQRKEIEALLLNRIWTSINFIHESRHVKIDKVQIITDHLNTPLATEYLDFLSRSSLMHLKKIYIILKNMREMANGPRTKENYRAGLQKLFLEQDRLFPQDWTPRPPSNGSGKWQDYFQICIMHFSYFMTNDWKLFFEERERFQKEHKTIDPWTAFINSIGKGPDEMLKHVDAMRSRAYERLTNSNIANHCAMVPERIFIRDGEYESDAAEKLFCEVNSGFEIRSERYADRWNLPFPRLEMLVDAVRYGSDTWLLLRRIRNGRNYPPLVLACLSDDGTVSPVIETPVDGNAFAEREPGVGSHPGFPFACDSRHVVLADLNRNIHIYDLELKRWTLIPDAAPAPLTVLAVASGRIWGITAGSLSQKDFFSMYSWAPDGSDRQIHFSTARSKPQNELDGLKIDSLNSLIVSGNALLFTVITGGHTRIYRFSMETKEFSCLLEFPFSGQGFDYLWRQKDCIYCFTMGLGERIYRIDPEQGKAEWIFSQTGRRYKFDPPDAGPVVLKSRLPQMNYPWAFHGKMLYGANFTPGAIRLDNVEKSPLLLLPSCACVFETADGVLFLGRHRYFFVREKISKNENGKESAHAPKQ